MLFRSRRSPRRSPLARSRSASGSRSGAPSGVSRRGRSREREERTAVEGESVKSKRVPKRQAPCGCGGSDTFIDPNLLEPLFDDGPNVIIEPLAVADIKIEDPFDLGEEAPGEDLRLKLKRSQSRRATKGSLSVDISSRAKRA